MRAEDHEFEEIVRARKQEDWLSCITLCREAIQHDAGSDPGRLYRLKLVLAFALLEDSKRSPASCDEAISVLEEVVVCVEPGSERWASVHRNLGFAYSVRTQGDREENLVATVRHLEKALVAMSDSPDVQLKASISAEIGHALVKIRTANIEEHVKQARERFHEALAVFTKGDFPEQWKEITDALRELDQKERSG